MNPNDNGQSSVNNAQTTQPKGFSYFVRKAEKLTTAIYMITDIISEKEPLRWKVREEAMDTMSLIERMAGSTPADRRNVFYHVLQSIDRIEHLLQIAKGTKLVSDMNASVVIREYRGVRADLEKEWDTLREETPVRIADGYFAIAMNETKQLQDTKMKDSNLYTLDSGTTTQKSSSVQRSQNIHKSIGQGSATTPIKDTTSNQILNQTGQVVGQIKIVRNEPVKEIISVKNSSGKTERRALILDMLKNKAELSVGEVNKNMPEVSDKTIQRELIAMVEEGILVRKGEKRWSTYTLPSAATADAEIYKE